MRAAQGRLVVLMDGGRNPPEDIPKLLFQASHYHMVVGARGGLISERIALMRMERQMPVSRFWIPRNRSS